MLYLQLVLNGFVQGLVIGLGALAITLVFGIKETLGFAKASERMSQDPNTNAAKNSGLNPAFAGLSTDPGVAQTAAPVARPLRKAAEMKGGWVW